MNILEQIYCNQYDVKHVPSTKDNEIRQLLTYIDRNCHNLFATLNYSGKNTLNALQSNYDDLVYLSSVAAFERGFKLAVKLMTA